MPSIATRPNTTRSTTEGDRFLHLTDSNIHRNGKCSCVTHDGSDVGNFRRRQSQQSILAKRAMHSSSNIHLEMQRRTSYETDANDKAVDQLRDQLGHTLSRSGLDATRKPAPPSVNGGQFKAPQTHSGPNNTMLVPDSTSATMALNDTPAHSAPTSPYLSGNHSSTLSDGTTMLNLGVPSRVTASGTSTPRVRPTTLDIPGLTKSKVSPDGRIAQRDVGSKLVIVMVGLPARGKSYITKKLARYLNWLQHDTKIFNVGERRRTVAGGPHSPEISRSQTARAERGLTLSSTSPPDVVDNFRLDSLGSSRSPDVAQIMLNDETRIEPPQTPDSESRSQEINRELLHDTDNDRELHKPDMGEPSSPVLARAASHHVEDSIEQDASFFDPDNQKASQIREQVARETLDELLDYILDGTGSVGILDATNSTMERRKMVMDRIRERAGPDLNVMFLESRCVDPELLEANMRLKLSGPDYKHTDPSIALADFKQRVKAYERAYVPLGDYEEKHNMPYIQMIDVGRKIISHQIKGFLMAQANYYLLNFNLAPRQIWITRHGLSMDNISGKLGGDSDLAPEGHKFAQTLERFIGERRREWDLKRVHSLQNSHFPPQAGDVTPPNPHYQPQSPSSTSSPGSYSSCSDVDPFRSKPFCVWTSMLKRSIQTAQYFNDEDYDTKQMRMLDELNAGVMEGLTYNCISSQYPEEYKSRKQDKLHYRYPGPGGEGYLDIINRLRPVIVELERMTDHVLLVGHRSVSRVLLAYFRGLRREEVADLDVPLGMLYCLEPKPYGVDFKAYKWDKPSEWFYEQPDFQLRRASDDML